MTKRITLKEGEVALVLVPNGSDGFKARMFHNAEDTEDKTLCILGLGLMELIIHNTQIPFACGMKIVGDDIISHFDFMRDAEVLCKKVVPGFDIRVFDAAEDLHGNC